jgi:hypothetical protein
MRVRLVLLVLCALGSCLSDGCSKKPGAADTPAQPQGTQPQKPQGTSAPSLKLYTGAFDQAAIHDFLASVREIKPTKFEVTWSADTVPVSREEALRSLRSISADGSTYVFASSEPVVAKLLPGKIVWIWGITIRRIDRLGQLDDATVVHTVAVPLSEAMTHADIELDTPLDFSSGYGTAMPRVKTPGEAATPSKTTRRGGASPLVPVLWQEGAPSAGPAPGQPGDSSGNSPEEVEAGDVVVGTHDGYGGKIAGFEYSIAYQASPSDLSLELQARRLEEEGGGAAESAEMHRDQRIEYFEYIKEEKEAEHEAAESYERASEFQKEWSDIKAYQMGQPVVDSSKYSGMAKAQLEAVEKLDQIEEQKAISKYKEEENAAKVAQGKAKALADLGALGRAVFFIISDNLDVRFRAKAHIKNASLMAALKLVNGNIDGSSMTFKDMQVDLDLEFVGRLGREGGAGVNIPVAHIPVAFNIPVIIYGVPCVAQVAADFLVKLYLAGHHAAQHYLAHFNLSGTGGFTATAGTQVNGTMSFTGSEPEVAEEEAMSPGVSGTVLAVQIPRLGFGLGTFTVAAIGFIDQVNVLTITNSAAVATLNPPCKRYTLNRVGHVGAELTTLLPVPFLVQLATHALSWKKEVWHAQPWEKVTPDIEMCHIH